MKNIKILSLLLVLSILYNNQARAQQFRSGVKGGLNFTNLYVNNVNNKKLKLGLNLGVFAQTKLAEAIAIQGELLYTTKGNRTKFSESVLGVNIDQEVRFSTQYLQLPLFLNFKIGDLIELHGGGYLAYLTNAKILSNGDIYSGEDRLNNSDFKRLDAGFLLGAAINLGNLQTGIRYERGLTKIGNSNLSTAFLGDSKNTCFSIYVALGLISKE